MLRFKGTPGDWEVIFDHYENEPKKICMGVGIITHPDAGIGVYTEYVSNSVLPDSDEEYIKQHEQIEADMKLMAASKKMLEALIEITEGKGRYSTDRLTHANNTIEDMIQLAKDAIAIAI